MLINGFILFISIRVHHTFSLIDFRLLSKKGVQIENDVKYNVESHVELKTNQINHMHNDHDYIQDDLSTNNLEVSIEDAAIQIKE